MIRILPPGLDTSFADTKKYKDEMTLLTENLAAMNKVYAGILGAMSQKSPVNLESNHSLRQAA
jgi:hypothetical protein